MSDLKPGTPVRNPETREPVMNAAMLSIAELHRFCVANEIPIDTSDDSPSIIRQIALFLGCTRKDAIARVASLEGDQS